MDLCCQEHGKLMFILTEEFSLSNDNFIVISVNGLLSIEFNSFI
jgi:hypothetical protein